MADGAQYRFSAESIKRLKQRLWVLKGVLEPGFKEEVLEAVAQRYEKI